VVRPLVAACDAHGIFLFASNVARWFRRERERTFAAAWCCRVSLACSIGTLAAVPGCMKMLRIFF
jgi:hypothetical protein